MEKSSTTPLEASALAGRNILLGVTGSIAIVKAPEIVSRLMKLGARVRVAMTASAREMIAPVTFEAITGHPVYSAMWSSASAFEMDHLSWSKWADLMLIAPASAHTLASVAQGLADNPVTVSALALEAPLAVAPAMNPAMYAAAATQTNLEVLRARGVSVLGPVVGSTACGDVGLGRMLEVDEIVELIEKIPLTKKDGAIVLPAATASSATQGDADALPIAGEGDATPLATSDATTLEMDSLPAKSSALQGRRILITAGPTREPIDAVRFLSNASTGKMGFALAKAAARRGALVELIAGPTPIPPPETPEIRVHPVETAVQMRDATMREIDACQVAIFSAAVADFRPANPSKVKSKKNEIDAKSLELVPNPDIAAEAGARNVDGQIRVGFAAETHELEKHALAKLGAKHLHMIVANDVSATDAGFAADNNAVTIYERGKNEETSYSLRSKDEIARLILDHIEKLLEAEGRRSQ